MPTFSGPASTVKASSLPASFRVLTIALKAAVTRLFTSMLPIAVEDGNTIEPPVAPLSSTQLASASPPIAAADASWPVWLMRAAGAGCRVERVGRGDRDAGGLGGLDDVVVGAGLRRGHDQAVDRRILDDLVQDLDLAGRIVHRRLRAEQQDVGADHVAGDLRPDIDRVEEAVAGGMGHDGEGQVPVGGMEILGAGGLGGGLVEVVAADRLLDAARLGEGERRGERQRRGARRERKGTSHGCPPFQPNGADCARAFFRASGGSPQAAYSPDLQPT